MHRSCSHTPFDLPEFALRRLILQPLLTAESGLAKIHCQRPRLSKFFELVGTGGPADDLCWGLAKLWGTGIKAKDGDMNSSQVSEYESGYFHLTKNGWTRKDSKPPPPDRLETWKYQSERPAPDAKDEVTLARVWISKDLTDAQSIALHERHGEAVLATRDRNVVLESYV